MSERVLVFSMGKAGSTTVMSLLSRNGIIVDRIHRGNVGDIDVGSYDYYITMVREPVARAISALWEANREGKTHALMMFAHDFVESFVFGLTGIDIIGGKDYERGYTIYRNMLVIRVEDFNQGLVPGVEALIGRPLQHRDVEHRAKGVERFGSEYQQSIDDTKFDEEYLRVVYDSPYCRKFGYDEVDRWRR